MKNSERLFQHVKEIWDSYQKHPFIQGINDGTLDQEKFKFYMIQDYIYLLDYTKVFALGVVKSKEERHMQLFGNMIQSIINVEADTHRDYMGDLGVTKEEIEKSPTSLTTDSYTKYMLAVAFEEGLAEVATAVLACSWSYKYIADQLDKDKDHGFYEDWVEMYCSREYAIDNQIIIDLVDELSAGYTETQLKNLEDIIWKCSRYEYMFWDMAWNMEM